MSPKANCQLVVKNLDEYVELEKRTNLPIEVSSRCPKCDNTVVKNLSNRDDYLSYPVINSPERLNFYHECPDGGDSEWHHDVILRVSLEEVKGK